MKKGLFTLIFTFYSVFCFGTKCTPGVLTTQVAITTFFDSNPTCDSIFGNIQISGPVTNLLRFNQIKYVSGTIVIANTNLATLSGLENISSSWGLGLINNTILTDVNALKNLGIQNNLTLIGNSALSQCCAFNPAIIALDTANTTNTIMISNDKSNNGCQSIAEIQADNSCLTVTSGGPSRAIPTLGEWALIQLSIFLMIIGVIAVQQTKPLNSPHQFN